MQIRFLNVAQGEEIPYRALLLHGDCSDGNAPGLTSVLPPEFPLGHARMPAVDKPYHRMSAPEYLDNGYYLSGYLLHRTAHVLVECEHFPPQHWPVANGYFKAVVLLADGTPTRISVTACGPGGERLAQGALEVRYVPPGPEVPRLRLAILAAADSPLLLDGPAERPVVTGNGPADRRRSLPHAIEQLRVVAYLWQAFTGEQLYRDSKGRRSFALEEDFVAAGGPEDTLTCQGAAPNAPARAIPRVHVLRSQKTLAELRLAHDESAFGRLDASERAEIEKNGRPDFFGAFIAALNAHEPFGGPAGVDQVEVAGLLLDSQWDPTVKLIRTHSALGGGVGRLRLGMFGSHCTYSWPSCFERIAPCLLDSTTVDPRVLSNDANEAGEYWRAFNIGAGAFLHEVGHLLTLWHTNSGIMARGYNNLNRAFLPLEPHRDAQRAGPLTARDEDGARWTPKLDTVRLWAHRCFVRPGESFAEAGGDGVQLGAARLLFNAAGPAAVDLRLVARPDRPLVHGIALLEFWRGEGESRPGGVCVHALDLVRPGLTPGAPIDTPVDLGDGVWARVTTMAVASRSKSPFPLPSALRITYEGLGDRVVTLRAVASNLVAAELINIAKNLADARVEIPGGGLGTRSSVVGGARAPNHRPWSLWLVDPVSGAPATAITVISGRYVHGLEVTYANGAVAAAGKTADARIPRGTVPLGPGVRVVGLEVSSGWWLDGLQLAIATPHAPPQRSAWFGGRGGDWGVIDASPGDFSASAVGLFGTANDEFIDSIGLVFSP